MFLSHQVEKLSTGSAKNHVGQEVLLYYVLGEGGKWCRGKVEASVSKELVTVYFTDYGHRGRWIVGT